jgi:hypothetical protein
MPARAVDREHRVERRLSGSRFAAAIVLLLVLPLATAESRSALFSS